MHEDPRFNVILGLLILLPKETVLDWIPGVDPNPRDITLEELRRAPDGFLVSQRAIETAQDAEHWVHCRWKMFFELFLFDWYASESQWLKQRRLKLFKACFYI